MPSCDDLIAAFREAAIAKGDYSEDPKEDHHYHEQMANACISLLGLGTEGIQAFRQLIHDDSVHVQTWVAAQILSEGEDKEALCVLETIAQGDGMNSFSAEMTVKEYKAGRLQSPFGIDKH